MANRQFGWAEVDEIIEWLLRQLGDALGGMVEDASEVFGLMSDGQRNQIRSRHCELALGLAALARRDRDVSPGLLPADERRAVVLGLFARSCDQRGVGGWQDRLARVINADSTLYRSLVFEFETAGIFAMNPNMRVDFIPEDSGRRVPELRLDNLVDVECKRLQGRSAADRHTGELWRQLHRRLGRLVAAGYAYQFLVEISGPLSDGDLTMIVDAARSLDSDSKPVVNVELDGGRISCELGAAPIAMDEGGVRGALPSDDFLEPFHYAQVEMAMQIIKQGGTVGPVPGTGWAAAYAFRTDQELDIERTLGRALGSARRQLPKDRPSIVAIDAYEPVRYLPHNEWESMRRVLDRRIKRELGGHGRPTGVVLSVPESPTEHPAKQSGFYVGNSDPSAPFPPDFELYQGWRPAESATLKGVEDDGRE